MWLSNEYRKTNFKIKQTKSLSRRIYTCRRVGGISNSCHDEFKSQQQQLQAVKGTEENQKELRK